MERLIYQGTKQTYLDLLAAHKIVNSKLYYLTDKN